MLSIVAVIAHFKLAKLTTEEKRPGTVKSMIAFTLDKKRKSNKKSNLNIIYTMINLVVQVCNRLARRACDEYYETKRRR